ncbi:hypothetical protein [Microvirga aerophila]|uniref:Uncharacterized protein n=1 Tax=Microvirga aerophila TaxID=670291 RepID=A0A512BT61_9HYPH|nr:hypothetical protein [Microvirga aerophila]GEO15151.1 hypothetical protein MAE02_28470 [Microvirga aerophila]
MPVTPADVALGAFTLCNTVRVFAYLPQIVKISRDTQGAAVISYTTWALFGVSHLSTVAYAALVVTDWRMAVIFSANTLCCVIIIGVTAWKRSVFKASQRGPASASTASACLAGVPAVSREVAANIAMKPAAIVGRAATS